MNPSVSVVIPVYNAESFLEKSLDSVFAQNVADIEVICVDDGSSDRSLDILTAYAEKEPRVIVLRQRNAGAGVARNAGVRVARGRYLDFMDPDDFLAPRMFETLLAKAERTDADIVISGMQRYDAVTEAYVRQDVFGGRVKDMPEVFSAQDVADRLFTSFLPSPCNKFIRREFFVDNRLEFQALPRSNDLCCMFTALALAKRITVVDEAFYCYRQGRQGSSQNTTDWDPTCVCKAYRQVRRNLESAGMLKRFERNLTRAAFSSCIQYTLSRTTSKRVASDYYRTVHSSYSDLFACRLRRDDFGGNLSQHAAYLAFVVNDDYDAYLRVTAPDPRPAVSVVMPAYNGELYLDEAIGSVLAQDFKDFELICIDDGSQDRTGGIFDGHAACDGRICVVHQENRGLGAARNVGIRLARGRYIMFIDADDKLAPGALSRMVGLMESCKLEHLVFCASTFASDGYDDARRVADYDRYYSIASELCGKTEAGESLFAELFSRKSFFASAPLRMLSTELLRENDCLFPEGVLHEDEGFSIFALLHARRAAAVSDRLYLRRLHFGSIMTSSKRNAAHLSGICSVICRFMAFDYRATLHDDAVRAYEGVLRGLLDAALRYSGSDGVLWDGFLKSAGGHSDGSVRDGEPALHRLLVFTLSERRDALSRAEALEKARRTADDAANAQKMDVKRAEGDLGWLRAKVKAVSAQQRGSEREIVSLKREISSLKESEAYRVGMFITWPARRAYRMLKCYRENGLRYTFRRLLYGKGHGGVQ